MKRGSVGGSVGLSRCSALCMALLLSMTMSIGSPLLAEAPPLCPQCTQGGLDVHCKNQADMNSECGAPSHARACARTCVVFLRNDLCTDIGLDPNQSPHLNIDFEDFWNLTIPNDFDADWSMSRCTFEHELNHACDPYLKEKCTNTACWEAEGTRWEAECYKKLLTQRCNANGEPEAVCEPMCHEMLNSRAESFYASCLCQKSKQQADGSFPNNPTCEQCEDVCESHGPIPHIQPPANPNVVAPPAIPEFCADLVLIPAASPIPALDMEFQHDTACQTYTNSPLKQHGCTTHTKPLHPNNCPTPRPTVHPYPSPTASASSTPTPSQSPTASPSQSPTPSPTP